MRRFTWPAVAAVVLGVCALAQPAHAQYIQVYSPPPVFSSPAVLAPSVSYYTPTYAPITSYYAPPVYSAPVTSYYAPPVYAAPVTSYYAAPVTYSYYPSTTVYSAPAAVVAPGAVTTRSFVGYGIFRPRGVYTQSYYSPVYIR